MNIYEDEEPYTKPTEQWIERQEAEMEKGYRVWTDTIWFFADAMKRQGYSVTVKDLEAMADTIEDTLHDFTGEVRDALADHGYRVTLAPENAKELIQKAVEHTNRETVTNPATKGGQL